MPMRHLAITADIALALDGQSTPDAALDWTGVNFVGCRLVGDIDNYPNVIFNDMAFLGSGALTFGGDHDTIAINNSFFSVPAGDTAIIIAADCTINRRFRANYSAMVIPATSTGIEVEDVASFTVLESFILDTMNFAGGGTFLDGIDHDDNEALISTTVGVDNSANVAQYGMEGNATTTSTVLQGTFYKIAGTTSAGAVVEKFDVATVDNRAIYKGALNSHFQVDVIASYDDGNFQDIALRIAKNGELLTDVTAIQSTGGGGRTEGSSLQALVPMVFDDYIEVWAANQTSAAGTLTVTHMNVIIKRI